MVNTTGKDVYYADSCGNYAPNTPLFYVLATAAGICALNLPRPNCSDSRQLSSNNYNKFVLENKSNLAENLERLTITCDKDVIADGIPTAMTKVDDAQANRLVTIDQLANAYDFAAEPTEGQLKLLRKRFENPTDLPQMHASEIKQVLRDGNKILRFSGGVPSFSKYAGNLRDLYKSITPEHLDDLSKGKKVKVRALTSQQQSLAYAAIVNVSLGRIADHWTVLESQLDSIESSWLEFNDIVPQELGNGLVGVVPTRTSTEPQTLAFGWVGKDGEHLVALLNAGPSEAGMFNRTGASPNLSAVASSITHPQLDPNDGKYGYATGRERCNSTTSHLDMVVHLRLGNTSLATVLAEISKQIGTKIAPATYLNQHELIVYAHKSTARQLLDGLASLNAWEWAEQDDGTVLVFRRSPRPAKDALDAAKRLGNTLPPDLRCFLRLGFEAASLVGREGELAKMGLYNDVVLLPRLRAQIKSRALELADELRHVLREQLAKQSRVRYRSMAENHQRNVVAILVLQMLARMCQSPGDHALLAGRPRDYLISPSDSEVEVSNGGIAIYFTERSTVRRGFSASIPN